MNNQPIKKETPRKEKSLTTKLPEATQEVNTVEEKELAPIVEGSRYFIPKTWVSEKQVLRMLQKTPSEHIYKRPGKGGQTWDYVTGTYIEKVLNFTFGWNWDFEILKQEIFGLEAGWGQIITTGKLTVKDDLGHSITKTQVGRKDVAYKKESKIPMDLGNDFKASATDALKKCASLFGIAGDIYGKEEFKEIKAPVKKAKAVEVVVEESAVDKFSALFSLARKFGAEESKEAIFIQEMLDRDIAWDSLTPSTIANIKTQLMNKLTPR